MNREYQVSLLDFQPQAFATDGFTFSSDRRDLSLNQISALW